MSPRRARTPCAPLVHDQRLHLLRERADVRAAVHRRPGPRGVGASRGAGLGGATRRLACFHRLHGSGRAAQEVHAQTARDETGHPRRVWRCTDEVEDVCRAGVVLGRVLDPASVWQHPGRLRLRLRTRLRSRRARVLLRIVGRSSFGYSFGVCYSTVALQSRALVGITSLARRASVHLGRRGRWVRKSPPEEVERRLGSPPSPPRRRYFASLSNLSASLVAALCRNRPFAHPTHDGGAGLGPENTADQSGGGVGARCFSAARFVIFFIRRWMFVLMRGDLAARGGGGGASSAARSAPGGVDTRSSAEAPPSPSPDSAARDDDSGDQHPPPPPPVLRGGAAGALADRSGGVEGAEAFAPVRGAGCAEASAARDVLRALVGEARVGRERELRRLDALVQRLLPSASAAISARLLFTPRSRSHASSRRLSSSRHASRSGWRWERRRAPRATPTRRTPPEGHRARWGAGCARRTPGDPAAAAAAKWRRRL